MEQEDLNDAYILVEAEEYARVLPNHTVKKLYRLRIISNVMTKAEVLNKWNKDNYWKERLSTAEVQIYKVDYNNIKKSDIGINSPEIAVTG